MQPTIDSINRTDLLKRIAPFVGIGVVGSWASALLPGPFDTEVALVALGLTVVLVLVAVLAPWDRLPPWTQMVTPLLFLGVVALTRHASGGVSSGLGAMVLLPIIWFALYGNRSQMALGVAGVAAVFLVPVVADRRRRLPGPGVGARCDVGADRSGRRLHDAEASEQSSPPVQ